MNSWLAKVKSYSEAKRIPWKQAMMELKGSGKIKEGGASYSWIWWLLLLLIIALIVYWVFIRDDEEESTEQ